MQWLEQFKSNLNSESGLDPRYSDDFLTVKAEIEKLSGINYGLIQQLCKKMLLEQVRDLRVAGFLVIASAYLDGLPGVCESLEIYRLLIANSWEKLHPQKIEAKNAALKLLNQTKILTFLQEKIINEQDIHATTETILNLNSALKSHVSAEVEVLTDLLVWLRSQKIVAPIIMEPEFVKKSSEKVEVVHEKITSQIAIDASVHQIIECYQQQKSLIAAAAFARALRWGNLEAPEHENRRTKIPAPRVAGIAQLHSLLQHGDPAEVFMHCENLFLEASFHWLLDLQFYAVNAARDMQDARLAAYLEMELISLINRYPELVSLSFVDQSPFAETATKEWVKTLLDKNIKQAPEKNAVDKTIEDYLEDTRNKSSRKNFAQQISFCSGLSSKNTREKFEKQRALAKLCVEQKRMDLAIPLLRQLNQQIELHKLAQWDSELAVSFWIQYYQTLEIALKKSQEPERTQLNTDLQQLQQLISQCDLLTAANLF